MRAAMFRQSREATHETESAPDILDGIAGIEVPDFGQETEAPALGGVGAAAVRESSLAAQAERALIGAILANNDLFDLVIEMVGPDAFTDSVAAPVFKVIAAIIEGRIEGTAVAEPMTISAQPGLAKVAPVALLERLKGEADVRLEVVTGRANIVREAHVRRGIDATIEAAQSISADEGKGVDAKQEEILKLLSSATELRSLPVVSLGDAALEAVTAMMERADKGETGVGISTSFADLDALTAGFHGGELIVLAARPGVGKTAFALAAGLAASAAGHHVVIASMEMKARELSKRALAIASGVDSQDIRMGSLSESDWEALVSAVSRLKAIPFDIVDLPSVNLSALSGLARRLKRAGKLDLLLVDYLQIMETTAEKGTNREQQIAELSRGLKKLAMQLDIPVVVLSQLKRPAPGHESKPPQLTDLRESGAIEQDADVVMFIHRPDVADKMPAAESSADIIVEKQRSGPQGVVQVCFERKTTGFFDFNSRHVLAANDPLRLA